MNVFVGETAQGNSAAVVILNQWLTNEELVAISLRLDVPVTAFVLKTELGYQIRWFAGNSEISLCGHGSLAAAHVLFEFASIKGSSINLTHAKGMIRVNKVANAYSMTLPIWPAVEGHNLDKYAKRLGLTPIKSFCTRDLVLVLDSEAQVREFQPDFKAIKAMDRFHALILTAKIGGGGYILRFFAPSIGINEDIATGSAQCSIAPYWLTRLAKKELVVNQLSSQGGYFKVSSLSTSQIQLTASVRLTKVLSNEFASSSP